MGTTYRRPPRSSFITLIIRDLRLKAKLSDYPETCERRRQQTIYLFIRRPSAANCAPPRDRGIRSKSLHYWSLDESGRTPLGAVECYYFGLPRRFRPSQPLVEGYHTPKAHRPKSKHHYSLQYSWDKKAYKAIREYQVARGFDPTTSDFARHLGYPIYKVVARDNPCNRGRQNKRIPGVQANSVQNHEEPQSPQYGLTVSNIPIATKERREAIGTGTISLQSRASLAAPTAPPVLRTEAAMAIPKPSTALQIREADSGASGSTQRQHIRSQAPATRMTPIEVQNMPSSEMQSQGLSDPSTSKASGTHEYPSDLTVRLTHGSEATSREHLRATEISRCLTGKAEDKAEMSMIGNAEAT
ncbi:hypothetical protein V5O48_015836 [Marasmius crinis-equi]|uniref:Uncharacterized protein n=1 Tax=Marasmius crinis-equi TaxID=585013 RepID=A0ABR3ETD4_9AGAR